MSENRLTALEQSRAQTDARLSSLERSLEAQGVKIDRLLQIVTRQEAMPQIDPFKLLGAAVQVFVIVGCVVSAIVYVASNVNAAKLAIMEERVNSIVLKGSSHGI